MHLKPENHPVVMWRLRKDPVSIIDSGVLPPYSTGRSGPREPGAPTRGALRIMGLNDFGTPQTLQCLSASFEPRGQIIFRPINLYLCDGKRKIHAINRGWILGDTKTKLNETTNSNRRVVKLHVGINQGKLIDLLPTGKVGPVDRSAWSIPFLEPRVG